MSDSGHAHAPEAHASGKEQAPVLGARDTGDGNAARTHSDDEALSRARALVQDLLWANPVMMATARRRVLAEPAELIIAELIAALGRPLGWVAYQRAATALAMTGDKDAMRALAREVERPGDFPILAIRALERAPNDTATTTLLRCLAAGRGRRARRVARALAAKHAVAAIVGICRLAHARDGRTDWRIRDVLKLYGRPAQAVSCVLAAVGSSVEERVDAIQAMEAVPGLFGRFAVQRHLDNEAADPRRPYRAAAGEVAHLYRNRTTLLRPSERSDDDRLLRPAAGADRTPTDRLVRPSEKTAAPAPSAHQTGLLSRIWETVKDVFEGH